MRRLREALEEEVAFESWDGSRAPEGIIKSLASVRPSFRAGYRVWTIKILWLPSPEPSCLPPFPASWPHTHLLPSCSFPQVSFPVESSRDGLFTLRARRGLRPSFPGSSLHEIVSHRTNAQKSVFTPHPQSPPQDCITPRSLSTGLHLTNMLDSFQNSPPPLTNKTRLNPLPVGRRCKRAQEFYFPGGQRLGIGKLGGGV